MNAYEPKTSPKSWTTSLGGPKNPGWRIRNIIEAVPENEMDRLTKLALTSSLRTREDEATGALNAAASLLWLHEAETDSKTPNSDIPDKLAGILGEHQGSFRYRQTVHALEKLQKKADRGWDAWHY